MSKFYPLIVSKINRETADAVSIELEIPSAYTNEFHYKQGQYLSFKLVLNGSEIRRSYSLCSAPSVDNKLRVAVKEVKDGLVSAFLNKKLKEGDTLESMPPMGNFFTPLNEKNSLKYVGIAAGSGITPILSLLKETLWVEKNSNFTLIYANKTTDSTIFKNELSELEKKYEGRLKIINLLSREESGNKLYDGRPDKAKLTEILNAEKLLEANHYFICGPEEMIMNSNVILTEKGIKKENVHFELFSVPVLMNQGVPEDKGDFEGEAQITVIIDGIETKFKLHSNDASILDASMEAGADAPFSCKGAVCCTCKAKVIKGKAILDMNYSLTDKEVADGYILTCQAHPQSAELVVDFDVP
jgi:ring-1,2-phenylacetyl-CoA epoxidase subunit PaaE